MQPSTPSNQLSLRQAAVISGICLLIMVVAAPFAEMYAYPKLVNRSDLDNTIANISSNRGLLVGCIFGYLLTFILDIVVSWSLYVLMRPVHRDLSLLTAWFRIVYTIIGLIALLNLVAVYRLVHAPAAFGVTGENLALQVGQYLGSFKTQWYFGLIFFSLHLVLLGYLVIRSSYIPKIIGVLLIITGLGYSLTTLKPFFFRDVNIDFAAYTFYGELVFMLWLLIRGWKIKSLP